MKMSVMSWKKNIFSVAFLVILLNGYAQPDSQLKPGKDDNTMVNSLLQQSKEQLNVDPTNAISLAIKAKELSVKTGFIKGEAYALKNIGLGYYYQGKYVEALEYWNESLKLFEQLKDDTGIANLLNNIAAVYVDQGNVAKGLEYSLRSLRLSEKTGDKMRILSALNTVGSIYYNKKETWDKALDYLLRALAISEEINDKESQGVLSGNIGKIYFEKNEDTIALSYFERSIKILENSVNSSFAYNGIGELYLKKGDISQSLKNHNKALEIAEQFSNKLNIVRSLMSIANVYNLQKDYSAALQYYNKASDIAVEINAIPLLKDLYGDMAVVYAEISDYKSAFKYQSLLSGMKDTLYNIEADKKTASLQFDFDLQKKQSEINLLTKDKALHESELKKQKYLRTGLFIGLALVLMFGFFQWWHSRQRLRSNILLQMQKNETELQKQKVEKTLEDLKMTQKQLIQSEKMASLGELTAGIAHEIQNPLNFVNNFSDVNTELIDEASQEIDKGNISVAMTVLREIKENEQKINHHGKRAGDIVKGMLQHSRSSSGVKEPTDINALADEYLRLAYHGIRAKDKSFNTTMKTDFDESIGNINIIAQDIGRVILNIITNAFYVVDEKKKSGIENYEPTVSVSTKKINGKIEIKVSDNGNGITQKVLDKIFQPFFTTKPTGQGTGLGLSLSYDIVKAHGGELKAKNNEDGGAEFVIILPI
ncbi:MAG: tetratricopeptide repeat protein [Chitinophagaceae bacterium]